MRTVVVPYLVLAMFLLGGCARPWYKSDNFKAYYYGMQEASLAATGQQIETFYFVDDTVNDSVEAAVREIFCDNLAGTSSELCVGLAETGSLGSELLLGKKLIGTLSLSDSSYSARFSTFIQADGVIEIVPWDARTADKKKAVQYSCALRPAVREMYLDLTDSTSVYNPLEFLEDQWVPLFAGVPPDSGSVPNDKPAKISMTVDPPIWLPPGIDWPKIFKLHVADSVCMVQLLEMACEVEPQ